MKLTEEQWQSFTELSKHVDIAVMDDLGTEENMFKEIIASEIKLPDKEGG